MNLSRRVTLGSLLTATIGAMGKSQVQDSGRDNDRLPIPKNPDEDTRLPNGKSQHMEMAKQEYASALKDADSLVATAQDLRDELKRAGEFVVPVSSVRKTEEIEKLAKRIRGRLKI